MGRVAGMSIVVTGLVLLGWLGWQYVGSTRRGRQPRGGRSPGDPRRAAAGDARAPGGVEPPPGTGRRLLTLVTCADLVRTVDRLVAFGHLVEVERRSFDP